MNRKSLLLLLLMAFFAPWAAQAQEELQLTVYDGTATSMSIPANIYNFDLFTRSQFVIPAGDLADISGGTIIGLTFYTNTNYGYMTGSDVVVYLKEVDYTLMNGFEPLTNATFVYEGQLRIFSRPGSNAGGYLAIDFDEPFEYGGGNLLVDIGNITTQEFDYSYSSVNFYGQEINGVAWGGTSSGSLANVTGSVRHFIPKTTITYYQGDVPACAMPSSVYVQGNPSTSYASINWTDGSGTYNVEYKKDSETNWTSKVSNYQGNGLILTNLSAGTKYQVRVQSVCNDGSTSGWRTQTFNTLHGVPFIEPFATSSLPLGWTRYSGLLSDVMAGTASLVSNSQWVFNTKNDVFDMHAIVNNYSTFTKAWLVTPNVSIQDGCRLTFDLALTKYTYQSGTPQPVIAGDQPDDRFVVLASTDGGTTWTILREWNNTTSLYYRYDDIATTGEHVSINLNEYNSGTLQIAFYCESTVYNGSNDLHIDNVSIVTATTNTFVNDGNWNDGSCWSNGRVPSPGSDVIIMANAVIPAGCSPMANQITIASNGSLTIADGGKLMHDTQGLVVTMKKNIVPYTNVNSLAKYHLLSFPFDMSVPVPEAMTANEGYDFYTFDPNKPFAEWRNNKQQAITTVGGITSEGADSGTTGYLYAYPEATEISLTGVVYPSYGYYLKQIHIPYDEDPSTIFNGWALLGNPYTCDAYVYYIDSDHNPVPMDYMMYDETGHLVTRTCGPINPMQGFFVKTSEATTVVIRTQMYNNVPFSIDLGLPSGTLWAACNLGASSPEDYGDYFAWGETTTKSTYNWSTYQYCNGSSRTLTKYCNDSRFGYNGFTDNLTTLLPEDDAATANWGDDWRMPTKEEFEELYNNTTVTLTTQNGVAGILFTASNGNSLFLPAAGCLDYGLAYAGSYGYYWSSSLYTDFPDLAWEWELDLNLDNYVMYYYYRCCGQSVRPVRATEPAVTPYLITAMPNSVEGGTVSNIQEGQWCTVTATPEDGYIFLHWTENGEVVSTDATYTFVVEGNRNLVAHFARGINGHAYIDLGLPSGMLWATCNVGADTPENSGDYFAWGETQPKENYYAGTYQYCYEEDDEQLTKYCYDSSYGLDGFTDDLTTLLPEDDAATANWGEGWRMPTQDEWEELVYNTTSTWTTQNGVNGRLFTASNGNSIFLPAVGFRYESNFISEGNIGYYWSSILDWYDPRSAGSFEFGWNGYMVGEPEYRIYGFSVRPVYCVPYTISVEASPAEYGNVDGGGVYNVDQTCTLTATANEGYMFLNWTEDDMEVSTDATYTFTVTGNRNLVAHFIRPFVDLGLPSGTLWATCNVGADNPEDYGDYFAWGETEPKTTYNWSTYQYCNGSENTLTKYCSTSEYGYTGYTDNLTILLPTDDAATVNWGSEWRMPSHEEWQELLDNTTNTWTTQNGVNGRLFTASNGNSIFMPAAGFFNGSSLSNAGRFGRYWLSSINTDYPTRAEFFNFISGYYYLDALNRYFGHPVRAVRVTEPVPTTFVVTATPNDVAGGTITIVQQGRNCTLTAIPNDGYIFVNWTKNGQVVSTDAIYTYTLNRNPDNDLVAHFRQIYVDLGLPSGTKWAICNVGAETPTETGDYFAWGETEPNKDHYGWDNYQHTDETYNQSLTRYCNISSEGYNGYTDNLTTLLPEDDAATTIWGDEWRMPTMEEWQELKNNTTCTYTTQDGVNGHLFTAANGNSLFLPTTGRYDGTNFNARSSYWSSTFYIGNSEYIGYNIWFGGDGNATNPNNNVSVSTANPYYGMTVRPVRATETATPYIVTATALPKTCGTVTNTMDGQTCTLTATPRVDYVFVATFINWTENGVEVSTNPTLSFTVDRNRNLVANFVEGNHTYVDLGLPSGTKWASCNVGADNPEDYGNYYAWGEIDTKSEYSWETYQHCHGDGHSLYEYCGNSNYGYHGWTDNLTTLSIWKDIAHYWGGNWRMPTVEEWSELYGNTTSTEATLNGVAGRRFTASNGNSIFLPYSGYYNGSTLSDAGSNGRYWSNKLNSGSSPNSARSFRFASGSTSQNVLSRCLGLSVRPVLAAQTPTESITVIAKPKPYTYGKVTNTQQGETCTLTATPNAGYMFLNWTDGEGNVVSTDATYSFTVSANRDLYANFTNEYVDLGLPSGIKWASCNLGATAPTEIGNRYAWGETSPKDSFTWENYRPCYGSENSLVIYCSDSDYGYEGYTDNLTTLMSFDDAATMNWGSHWRIPTNSEWHELYNSTTRTSETVDGVPGVRFTASNGNSIFVPAAGFLASNGLNCGDKVYYWENQLNWIAPSSAYSFNYEIAGYADFVNFRYNGLPVRAVYTAEPNTTSSHRVWSAPNPVEGGRVTNNQQGETCTLTATPKEGYAFVNWTRNGVVLSTNPTYSFTVTGDCYIEANFMQPTYVDLGLPTGTLWATCNVGAATPEGYGNYFAWGETSPKENYTEENYQHCNGDLDNLTKYCDDFHYGYNFFTDNLTTLLPEDDAATANWGDDWCMPTYDEWTEFYDYTTSIWTTRNGVSGRLFTGPNGNTIFLPAAGHHDGASAYDVGSRGQYWLSSLSGLPNKALLLCYYSSQEYLGYSERNQGLSVRPIHMKYTVTVAPSTASGGTISGGGRYNQGATCTVTATANSGYMFVNWTDGDGNVVSTDATYSFSLNSSCSLVANFITGYINGLFTINSNGDQVYFSKGNLQYRASTNTWRFAEHQWDYVGTQTPYEGEPGGTVSGSDNANVSPTYSGWIDLFAWGTSGYDHGAVCYQPWSTDLAQSNYYAYGAWNKNLYDESGMADWGYNAIINGGNIENSGWRTLTDNDRLYLLLFRQTASGIRYVLATVNNVKGMILLPDDWSTSYYNLDSSEHHTCSNNIITASQWNTLEQHGAVFLPISCWRDGLYGRYYMDNGYYWLSDCAQWSTSHHTVYDISIHDSYIGIGNSDRSCGQSVRLVHPVGN